MNCQFSDPVNYLGETPVEDYETWNFKTLTCEREEFFEHYENPTTGSSFYLDKRISYGDIFTISLIVGILTFALAKIVANFVFKK